jgi:hypothetical protein
MEYRRELTTYITDSYIQACESAIGKAEKYEHANVAGWNTDIIVRTIFPLEPSPSYLASPLRDPGV